MRVFSRSRQLFYNYFIVGRRWGWKVIIGSIAPTAELICDTFMKMSLQLSSSLSSTQFEVWSHLKQLKKNQMCFKCFRILDTLSFLSLSPSSSWVTASSYSHDFESCAGEILPLLNVNALTVVAGELAWFEIVCLSKLLIWYLGKDILPFYTLTPRVYNFTP